MARKRYDGTEIKLSPLKTVEPYIMKRRTDSWVIANFKYDLSKTLPFIERYNRERNLDKKNRLTLFQILLVAGGRTIAQYPKLNRFISGKKFYQRNRLNFSFAVKRDPSDQDSRETFTKFDVSPYETLDTFREKIHAFVGEARSDKGNAQEGQVRTLANMPHRIKSLILNTMSRRDDKGKMSPGMIESDLVYCSAVWANLGSVGVPGMLSHHLFAYGNASIFITVGSIEKGVVIENNEMYIRDILNITYCIDERISSGKYFGLVLRKLQELSENPEQLLEKPDIPEKAIKELNLVDLMKYKPYLRLQKNKK